MRRTKTTKTVLATVLILGLFGSASPLNFTNIIGGDEASPGEFPYMVSLTDIRFGTNRHFCAGAIYSDSYILTAAHCIQTLQATDFQVWAGEYDRSKIEGHEQMAEVKQITKHPDFDPSTMENDIAIVKLQTKLTMNDFVGPIALANTKEVIPTTLTLMGWGSIAEGGDPVDILRKVTLPTWTESDCATALKTYDYPITETNLCAGSEEADGCHGDDGGPLVSNGLKLFGLVSWSIGCARPGTPGVYTKVSAFKQWIESVTVL